MKATSICTFLLPRSQVVLHRSQLFHRSRHCKSSSRKMVDDSVQDGSDVTKKLTHGYLASTLVSAIERRMFDRINQKNLIFKGANPKSDQPFSVAYGFEANHDSEKQLSIFLCTDESLETLQTPHFNLNAFLCHLRKRPDPYIVVYLDSVTSTQSLIESLFPLMETVAGDASLVITAFQQIMGHGRRERIWASPAGCAMFSHSLKIPLDSFLGSRIGFVQHIMAVAILKAIDSLLPDALEIPEIKIKWPNDIYYKRSKIGGIIVKTLFKLGNRDMVIFTGVGINVDNQEPTICLNQIIQELVKQHSMTQEAKIKREQLIAAIIIQFDLLVNLVQTYGQDAFGDVKKEYVSRWMHTNQRVQFKSSFDPNKSKRGLIVDVDDNGYLMMMEKDEDSCEKLTRVDPDYDQIVMD